MSDDQKKASIPSWQQAGKLTERSTAIQPTPAASTPAETVASTAAAEATTTALSDADETAQREQIAAFLQDPGVKDEPIDKKRAFLLTKDMPAHLVDEALNPIINATELEVAEFQSQVAEQRKLPSAPTVARSTSHLDVSQAPPAPIITYPEFLAEAHQSAPLVTPARVIATTYVAAATAVLTYAASTFLIKPMTAALVDARHEFAGHSKSKVDELNERLEKLVSQVPGIKKIRDDDSESTDSDASELISKDEATQTEAGPEGKVTILEPTATVKQVEKLATLQKHLESILTGAQKEADVVQEREESVKKLRHYLDALAYGSSGINVWSNSGGQFSWEQQQPQHQQQEKERKDDAIEDLKKEIRGVKGVLLSAKRFPAAARMPSGATSYNGRRGVDTAA